MAKVRQVQHDADAVVAGSHVTERHAIPLFAVGLYGVFQLTVERGKSAFVALCQMGENFFLFMAAAASHVRAPHGSVRNRMANAGSGRGNLGPGINPMDHRHAEAVVHGQENFRAEAIGQFRDLRNDVFAKARTGQSGRMQGQYAQSQPVWAQAVNRRGGDVSVVCLPEIGIRGNTDFPFSDLNNVEIADEMSKFLKEKGLD